MNLAKSARILAAVAACVSFTLAVTACSSHSKTASVLASASANPTVRAELVAGEHIATQVFYTCARQMGGKVPANTTVDTVTKQQVLQTLAQPALLANLAHPSGLLRAYECFKQHIPSHSQRHAVLECWRSAFLNATSLTSKQARDAAAQAAFSCSGAALAVTS